MGGKAVPGTLEPQELAVGQTCTCAAGWSSPKDGAGCVDQSGCPTKACDGDADGSWCIVDNPGCSNSADPNDPTWFYCTPEDSTTIAMADTTSGSMTVDDVALYLMAAVGLGSLVYGAGMHFLKQG